MQGDRALLTPSLLPGSFRDPAGHVFFHDGRIFRTVSPTARENFRSASHELRTLVTQGRLVAFEERDPALFGFTPDQAALVLEHPRIEPWSFPYEWSFSLLRDAALFHLELHLDLLERGFTLCDASAYNVQFVGPKPVFIDHLSIRPYEEGEFWVGHKQFCEQFLNPLLLRAYLDIAPNAWYRGNLEGIPTEALAKLLPLRRKVGWRGLSNVVLPAYFQRSRTSEKSADFSLRGRKLPLRSYQAMLRQLLSWIADLIPANTTSTTWANYATTTTYDDDAKKKKASFVADFVRDSQPRTVIDLGCNTGDYSKAALLSGANSVVGFDFDQQSLDRAHMRAKTEQLNFLPLFLDARNPSPSQGWMQMERSGFIDRYRADAVLALAFEHHLAIAHNVPLGQLIEWLVSLAPRGVVEFVPKTDPTVVKMLALRDDVFSEYSLENFATCLSRVTTIQREEVVSRSGRTLFAYGR